MYLYISISIYILIYNQLVLYIVVMKDPPCLLWIAAPPPTMEVVVGGSFGETVAGKH